MKANQDQTDTIKSGVHKTDLEHKNLVCDIVIPGGFDLGGEPICPRFNV